MQSTGSLVIVHFRLGSQQYGLRVEAVREVVRLPALVALAGAVPILCGILNLHGSYLPVLNGRTLVGEAAHYDLNSQIIVIGNSHAELGLLVDEVSGVATFTTAMCTPIQCGAADTFLEGVLKHPQGAMILLNHSVLRTYAADGYAAQNHQPPDISSYDLTFPEHTLAE